MTNFFDEKWGGSGRPSRPASDGPVMWESISQGNQDGYFVGGGSLSICSPSANIMSPFSTVHVA